MTPLLIERLKLEVTGLQSRVSGLASLTALTAKDSIPNVTPCAHVMPSGIQAPTKPPAVSGGFIQNIERGFSVFLSLRVHDPNGARALDEAEQLIDAIILAVAGWEPTPQSIGVFVFRQAALRTIERGVAIYEISFSITDQLRISQ